MRFILVLGKMLLPDGSPSEELKLQMQRATLLMNVGKGHYIIIAGGVTRKGFISEAAAARQLLPPEFRNFTILEEESTSTLQNIQNVKKLIQGKFRVDSMSIVSSPAHAARTNLLFKKFWPEVAHKISFRSVGKSSLKEWVIHGILYALALLDTEEKIFLPLLRRGA